MPKHPVELKPVLLAALISCYGAVSSTSVCRHVHSSHTVWFDKGLTPCSLVSVGTSPLGLSSLLAAPIPIHPSSFPFLGKCWGRMAVPHPGTSREQHLMPWHCRMWMGCCQLLACWGWELYSPPEPTTSHPTEVFKDKVTKPHVLEVCQWPRAGLQDPCSLFQVAVPGRCVGSAPGNSSAVSCSSIGLFSGHEQRLRRQNVQV